MNENNRTTETADQHFFMVVLFGWFGLHKFKEGKIGWGIWYAVTCGCSGILYLWDLYRLYKGTYCYTKVVYVGEGQNTERKEEVIYYGPLEDAEKAKRLLIAALVILFLAINLIYRTIGKILAAWFVWMVLGHMAERLMM